jgi:hypothetical protein
MTSVKGQFKNDFVSSPDGRKQRGGCNAKAPQVLIPFDSREAVSISEAARIAGRTVVTMRAWAAIHDLGRMVGGRWAVSRVALAMHLDNDRKALQAYLDGDRHSPGVISYFERLGLAPEPNR